MIINTFFQNINPYKNNNNQYIQPHKLSFGDGGDTFAKRKGQTDDKDNKPYDFRWYSKEIDKIPTLTPEERQEIYEKINAGREAELTASKMRAIEMLDAIKADMRKISDLQKLKKILKQQKSPDKAANNIATEYIQGQESEKFIRKIMPAEHSDEIMEMITKDCDVKEIAEKIVPDKKWVKFFNRPDIQNEEIIYEFLGKKETHIAHDVIRLVNAVKKYKQLDKEKEDWKISGQDYEKVIEDGNKAQKRLTESSLKYVPGTIRFFIKDLGFDKAVQIGNLALMRAAKNYDYTKDASFKTYAKSCIQKACWREIKRQNDEVTTISLNDPIGGDEDLMLNNVIRDEKTLPSELKIDKKNLNNDLNFLLLELMEAAELSPNEIKVLQLRQGNKCTLENVAPRVNLSIERTRQIEKSGFTRLLIKLVEIDECDKVPKEEKDKVRLIIEEDLTPEQQKVVKLKLGLDDPFGKKLSLKKISEEIGNGIPYHVIVKMYNDSLTTFKKYGFDEKDLEKCREMKGLKELKEKLKDVLDISYELSDLK